MRKECDPKAGDAIIAIDDGGAASLVMLLSEDEWKNEFVSGGCNLEDFTFEDAEPGLWYANMVADGCGIEGHARWCEGDCFSCTWELAKPLCTVF